MIDLYFIDYGYWSYSNRRKTPVYQTIDDYAREVYAGDVSYFPKAVNNVNNFNFGDGVLTQHYINYTTGQKTEYTYMLITDAGSHDVVSRWFVLECYEQRNGQLRLTLKRDVLADINQQIYYGRNLFYCERGVLQQYDQGIYNSENGTYNQVKTREYLLKDSTKCPWIVGYMATPKDGDSDIQITIEDGVSDVPIRSLSNVNQLPGYLYSNLVTNPKLAYDKLHDVDMLIHMKGVPAVGPQIEWWRDLYITPGNTSGTKYSVSATGALQNFLEFQTGHGFSTYNCTVTAQVIYDQFTNVHRTNWLNQFKETLGQPTSEAEIFSISIADKYLYNVNGTLYKATVTKHTHEQWPYWSNLANSTYAGREFRRIWNTYTISTVNGTKDAAKIKDVSESYTFGSVETRPVMTWYEISYSTTTVTQPGGSFTIKPSRRTLKDQPFCMFAIPCDKLFCNTYFNQRGCDLITGKKIAAAISKYASGRNGFLYDIQLVPYCPLQTRLNTNGTISETGMSEHVDYMKVMNGSTLISYIYWCEYSTFSFAIEHIWNPPDYKIANELEFCRLQSPNMASSFQFSPAKNEGIDYFNVDCTYKPYQPYIHVAPNFKGLYGGQYGTGVGLICSGDFSLPMTTDGWAEFMRNNVNYENMFNRQIENMEVKNSVARTMENWSIGTGALSGAGSGALLGSLGGPVGSVIGGVVGGVSSLAGGIADKYYNEQLRSEEMDFTKDLHQMSSQNIQALPDTLTKVGAFTANNKIFPFLEYYQATGVEYEALRQKLNWYGMNVGRVGTFTDFINAGQYDYISLSFVKGNFLRIPYDDIDDHFRNAVNEELSKGVYV